MKTFQGIRGRTSIGIPLVKKAKSNETRSGGIQDRMLALLEGQNRLQMELKEEQDRLKEELKILKEKNTKKGKTTSVLPQTKASEFITYYSIHNMRKRFRPRHKEQPHLWGYSASTVVK